MRQEVRVQVTLTYDADAELRKLTLRDRIRADLLRLVDHVHRDGAVQLTDFEITRLQEEASIYGANDDE